MYYRRFCDAVIGFCAASSACRFALSYRFIWFLYVFRGVSLSGKLIRRASRATFPAREGKGKYVIASETKQSRRLVYESLYNPLRPLLRGLPQSLCSFAMTCQNSLRDCRDPQGVLQRRDYLPLPDKARRNRESKSGVVAFYFFEKRRRAVESTVS